MHWIWEGVIGLIAGGLAKLIMPGKDPGGIIVTMLLGIAGSYVATYLGTLIGWYQEGQKAGFLCRWRERCCCWRFIICSGKRRPDL